MQKKFYYAITLLIALLLISNGWWWYSHRHALQRRSEVESLADSVSRRLVKEQAYSRKLESDIRYFWHLLSPDSSVAASLQDIDVLPRSVANKIIHHQKLRQQLLEQLLRAWQEQKQLRRRKDMTEQEIADMRHFLQSAEQVINLFSDSLAMLAVALDSAVRENRQLKMTEAALPVPLEFVSSKGRTVFYYGQSVNERANGKGVGIFWESGSLYKGEWKDNLRHGRGIFQWKDGELYEGEFRNDRREGYGIYRWKNGEYYEGQWLNDMRHGNGTLYDKNNKVKFQGLWDKDKPVRKTDVAN